MQTFLSQHRETAFLRHLPSLLLFHIKTWMNWPSITTRVWPALCRLLRQPLPSQAPLITDSNFLQRQLLLLLLCPRVASRSSRTRVWLETSSLLLPGIAPNLLATSSCLIRPTFRVLSFLKPVSIRCASLMFVPQSFQYCHARQCKKHSLTSTIADPSLIHPYGAPVTTPGATIESGEYQPHSMYPPPQSPTPSHHSSHSSRPSNVVNRHTSTTTRHIPILHEDLLSSRTSHMFSRRFFRF